MFNWIQNVCIFTIKVFILSIIPILILQLINKKINNKVLKQIIDYLFYIPALMFFILIIDFFVATFTYAISFVFYIVNGLLYVGIQNQLVSNYISLVISLTVLAYFPDLIGRLFIRIYERIVKTGLQMEKHYSVVVKFIRFKLWIYLAAFILMFISTIETILQKSLFSFNLWLELKPVIFQSVVTFIALDRFLKILGDEWQTIKDGYYKVLNTLKSLFNDITNREKDGC